MEPPPLSVPVKEAREAESAAPRIGNLDGFGGGGSSEPVDPATNPNSLVSSCTKTVEHGRLRKWSFHPLSWRHIWVTNFNFTKQPAWENSLHSVATNTEILHNLLFCIWVSVHHKSIIYNKPTRCNSGSIVFINNYRFALHVSDALLRPSSGALWTVTAATGVCHVLGWNKSCIGRPKHVEHTCSCE